jgi:Copper transport outer membrane protein, MctB
LFDYRYHALSLAAVLLALAVGVVIGVAIGDSNLVSSAKNGIVHNLQSEVSGAQRQAGELRSQLSEEEAFSNDLYPIAVHGLLSGRSIGLVFLGGSSNQMNGFVRDAVTQAGGNLGTVVAVREPLDLSGIAREAAGTRYAALAPEATPASATTGATTTAPPAAEGATQLVEEFGALVGRQLVSGGQNVNKELLSRARGRLLTAFDGQLGRLEGLVLVRADPSGMTPEDAKTAAVFESGLLEGVTAVGVTMVGAELTRTEPSQISWYQGKDLSSVDDLDTTAGRAALVYALTGSHGSYGTKSTADSLLPNVVGASTQP